MLRAEYIRKINKSCFILTPEKDSLEDKESVKDSIEMFRYNKIPYFLTMQAQHTDVNEQLCYDITGRRSLQQILEYKSLEYEMLYQILHSFDMACAQTEDYMLSENDIFLNPEFVFLESDSKQMFFCYLPEYQKDIWIQFKEFMEYLLQHLDHKDERAVQLAYGIYQKVVEEEKPLHFILKNQEQLKNYFQNRGQKLKNNCSVQENCRENLRNETNNLRQKIVLHKEGQMAGSIFEEQTIYKEIYQTAQEMGVELPQDEVQENYRKIKEENRRWKTDTHFKPELKTETGMKPGNEPGNEPGMKPEMKPGNEPEIRTESGTGTKIENGLGNEPGNEIGNEPGNEIGNEPENEPGNELENEPEDKMIDEMKAEPGNETQRWKKTDKGKKKEKGKETEKGTLRTIKHDTPEPDHPVRKKAAEKLKKMLYRKIFADTSQYEEEENVFEPEMHQEAVFGNPTVCLMPKTDGIQNKFVYQGADRSRDFQCAERMMILGSDQNECDICIPLPVVSRVHARIELDEKGTYLEDMNSTNGTYVNGKILQYRERHMLQIGDIISLAGENYSFH